jgi:L-alanine-DL-glutamate epimerase-like enolase superfamily enzyme
MSKIREVRVYDTPPEKTANFGEQMPEFVFEALLVRITDEDGRDGFSQPIAIHGEGRFLARYILDVLAPMIIGEDARHPEGIWQKMVNSLYGQPRSAVGLVDIAVWDLAGKIAGVSVLEMLGGYRHSIPAYASTMTYATPADYAAETKALVDEGYQAIKLHVYGEARRDIEACEVARDAVGPDIDLMLDVVGGYLYDKRTTMEVGRALERLDFYWYEHPLREDDVDGQREICRALDIPVAGPDGLRELSDHAEFIRTRATDMIRPDAEFQGGITMQMKIGHMAELFRIGCEPHSWGYPMMQAANLMGTLAIPRATYYEVAVPTGFQDLLSKNVIRPDAEGIVHAPTGPGLGIEIDLEELESRGTEL